MNLCDSGSFRANFTCTECAATKHTRRTQNPQASHPTSPPDRPAPPHSSTFRGPPWGGTAGVEERLTLFFSCSRRVWFMIAALTEARVAASWSEVGSAKLVRRRCDPAAAPWSDMTPLEGAVMEERASGRRYWSTLKLTRRR